MSYVERYPFDEGVIAAVEQTAQEQQHRPLADIAESYGVNLKKHQSRASVEQLRRVEYLDLVPSVDRQATYDDGHARVLFTPVDTPIGERVARQALRLFGAQPDRRLIVVGGPAASGLTNTVRFGDAWNVWKGKLESIVNPALMLLKNEGIKTVEVLGNHSGAVLAATAAADMGNKKRDLQIDHVTAGVFAFPSDLRPRNPSDVLRENVPVAADAPYGERLRATANRYRLSHFVVANAMARGDFYDRIKDALASQAELRPTFIWSDGGDRADDDAMERIISKLQGGFGRRHTIGAIALEGVNHKDLQTDDDLHTAVMLQGLRAN